MTRRLAKGALLFGMLLSLHAPSALAQAGDAWKALDFLVGTWEARTEGGTANAVGSGTYTFQRELRGHVLARHATNGKCAAPDDFDCEHADALYIFQEAEGTPLKAIYFDNEGHVIHYEVGSPAPNNAVFLSLAGQPGPRFRLVYQLENGIMHGKFQMAAPGQDDFKSYLEWSGRKK